MSHDFQVIPVIDLKGGGVVHAVAGKRNRYRAIDSSLCENATATKVAKAYSDFGFRTAYVADLDAIAGSPVDQPSLLSITQTGLHFWLDAGVTTAKQAHRIAEQYPGCRIVIGLESLTSKEAMIEIAGKLPTPRLVFSIDLHGGQLITSVESFQSKTPLELVRNVVNVGFQQLIVLDLENVGTSTGSSSIDICRLINKRFPDVDVWSGGGVRNCMDLLELRDAGCRGALVATALHRGHICQSDLNRFDIELA